MDKREAINQIMSELKQEIVDPNEGKGGQHCGIMPRGVRVSHPDIDVEIYVNYKMSQYANRELARTLFELALNVIIK